MERALQTGGPAAGTPSPRRRSLLAAGGAVAAGALASYLVSARSSRPVYAAAGDDPYNVKTVGGARGDGVTDDTAAIQSTINTANGAGGGTVFFPAGTYVVSATLVIPITVSIRGSGRQSIVEGAANPLMSMSGVAANKGDLSHVPIIRDIQLQVTGTNGALTITGQSSPIDYSPVVILDGVHFNAFPNGGSLSTLLTITDVTNLCATNCDFISFSTGSFGTSNGVLFNGCANCHLTNCVFTYLNVGSTLQKDPASGDIPQGLFFTNCHWNGCSQSVVTSDGTAHRFVSCMIDNTPQPLLSTNDSDIALIGCYIGRADVSNSHALSFAGATGIHKIIGNQIVLYGPGNAAISIAGGPGLPSNNSLIADNIFTGARPANAIALNFVANTVIHDNQFSSGSSGSTIAHSNPQGNSSYFHNNWGYNPVGQVGPPAAAPANGAAYTNTYPFYVRVYVNGTNLSINIAGGGPLGASPGTSVYLAPGETIRVNGDSLGWAWYGD